jgi:hypothetical protein
MTAEIQRRFADHDFGQMDEVVEEGDVPGDLEGVRKESEA